eukprot:TRINITY_DN2646_c0_g1_i1.p2 TRINITY_DN2646_c0_g1~~TRINITY_DN2646_c0_g1_i1.p2  ORF type:complete len:178 (-),score=46.70 TRINITY_DN2646_c0_g1_i1:17-550(-)
MISFDIMVARSATYVTCYVFFFFFFSSRRRHTRCREVSWARRCVQETGINAEYMGLFADVLFRLWINGCYRYWRQCTNIVEFSIVFICIILSVLTMVDYAVLDDNVDKIVDVLLMVCLCVFQYVRFGFMITKQVQRKGTNKSSIIIDNVENTEETREKALMEDNEKVVTINQEGTLF